MNSNKNLDDLVNVVRKLRQPDGCPWDSVQTHESLKACLIEECYEVIEAIDNKDIINLREELGDVLLQVVFHSILAEEENSFKLDDVIDEVTAKMIRRHPQVFGTVKVEDGFDGVSKWEDIKKLEKQQKGNVLETIPKAFPAAIRAQKVRKKAIKEYNETIQVMDTIQEIEKLLTQIVCNKKENIGKDDNNYDNKNVLEDIVGKLLFNVVEIAEEVGINAEKSLTKATEKYINKTVRSGTYK